MTKSTSDLATFLESVGIEDIVDYGDEIGGRCLKHRERTGAEESNPRHWFLNSTTKEHHCFSCGYKGNLRSLVVDLCNGDVWKAATLLQQFTEEEMFRPFEEPKKTDRRDLPVQLGFMEFGWPTDRALKKRGISLASCKHFGIRWEENDSAWILPIRQPDPPHDLMGWQAKSGRFVRNRPYRVPKGTTLFGIERLESGREALLVESPLDVAWLYEVGLSAVASYGDRVTPEQMRLLLHTTPRLILALDNDKAGISSMQEITAKWGARFPGGMLVFNYDQAPGAKDPGEMEDFEIRQAVESADPVPYWEHHHDLQRRTAGLPKRSRGADDRAQIIARRLSAGSGKNRDLHSSRRAPDRRR